MIETAKIQGRAQSAARAEARNIVCGALYDVVSRGMAPPKGHPRWGGRKPGLSNLKLMRREAALSEAIAAALTPEQVEALSPLEIMRSVMRSRYQRGDEAGALAAAALAAPFMHPRLQVSEVTVKHGTAGRSDAEVALEIESLRRRIEAARTIEAIPLTLEARAEPVEAEAVEAVPEPSD
jgi:hypothetical protein